MSERSLGKVSTEDISGFTKLKAVFKASNSQLAEQPSIRREMFFVRARLWNALRIEDAEAFQSRSDL